MYVHIHHKYQGPAGRLPHLPAVTNVIIVMMARTFINACLITTILIILVVVPGNHMPCIGFQTRSELLELCSISKCLGSCMRYASPLSGDALQGRLKSERTECVYPVPLILFGQYCLIPSEHRDRDFFLMVWRGITNLV
jgi:hypothetical protein